MRRLATIVVATIVAAMVAAPAAAQSSADYDVGSRAWNGLSKLEAIAEGMNLEAVAVDQIDWSDLGATDVLFILYPRQRIQPTHLYHFIGNGGRVLLADDFGNSGEILARLGLQREVSLGVDAGRFHDDLAFAPLATPFRQHPLSDGVSELATNHPAVFTTIERGTSIVFGFGDNEGVVAAGELNGNRFVALSDPSVLINRMLQFEGNLAFAINLLRYLRRDDSNRLVILSGDFAIYGEPSGLLENAQSGSVGRMLSDFNRWLDERNDYLLKTSGMRAIALIVAMLIVILALVLLPLRHQAQLDGAWTRATSSETAIDDFEKLVGQFDGGSARNNHVLPAAVLRDVVNTRLERILERPEPLFTLGEPQLYRELGAQRGADAVAQLKRVYRRLKVVPSRVQAASPWSVGYLSRRDFERLHADVDEALRLLGDDR